MAAKSTESNPALCNQATEPCKARVRICNNRSTRTKACVSDKGRLKHKQLAIPCPQHPLYIHVYRLFRAHLAVFTTIKLAALNLAPFTLAKEARRQQDRVDDKSPLVQNPSNRGARTLTTSSGRLRKDGLASSDMSTGGVAMRG
jgi:hypothetical protein